jgi:hypothetical protein
MNPSADAAEQTTTLQGAAGELIRKGRGWSGAREWSGRRDGGGIAVRRLEAGAGRGARGWWEVGAGGGPVAYWVRRGPPAGWWWSVRLRQRELVVAAAAWRGGWVSGPWTRDLVKRALADQQVKRGLTGRFFHDKYFENKIVLVFWAVWMH